MMSVRVLAVGLLGFGLFLAAVSVADPSFAVLDLNTSAGGTVSQTVSPFEASGPQSLTFNQAVSTTSQASYSVSQSWSNVQVWGAQTVSMGLAFPVGQWNNGAFVQDYETGTATAVLSIGSASYTWTYTFDTNAGPYDTVNPSFSIGQSNFLGTVSLKLTVTAPSSNTWTYTEPSGSVVSISPLNGIQGGISAAPSTQSFNIYGFTYSSASISFAQLLSSNILSYTLDWTSTQAISIQYNGNTGSGTSGSFANSPPSATSVATNIQAQSGSSYTVTLSLSDIVYQNTQSGITGAGSFYINTGSQWVKVTPTSSIKMTVSAFPANISFAYVEDNGTTAGASYAYIIAAGLQYNIPFSNSTTVGGHTAYTVSIPFPAAGNYTVNGFLESSQSNGGSLQLMSFTWNTGSGSGTGGTGGTSSYPGVNYAALGAGLLFFASGILVIRRYGL